MDNWLRFQYHLRSFERRSDAGGKVSARMEIRVQACRVSDRQIRLTKSLRGEGERLETDAKLP